MALTPATIEVVGNAQVWSGGIGVNAGDIVVQTGDVTKFDDFQLMSTTGALQVFASLDGANYVTAPLALLDEGAAAVGQTFVTVTAAGRLYRLQGTFALIQVKQSGAGATANVTLLCTKKGGQY